MAFPRKCFVATSTLGVYYTANLDDPERDPTWTTVNDGLPATTIQSFEADPLAPEMRQWCIVNNILYRRVAGEPWEEILTNEEAQGYTGEATGYLVQIVS